jgi:dual specificity tyrosine-phosphorylation-regulated kinase 2/3/4
MGNLAKADSNQSSENVDFLAPINFDDFHNSIMAEPSLNHFPMPGNGGENRETGLNNPWEKHTNDKNASERTRGPPSARRKSEVQRPNGQPPNAGLTASTANTRARRQSLAQPSAGNTASRGSRKSISSGAFAPTNASARRASLSVRKFSTDTTQPANNSLRPRTQDSDVKVPSAIRNLKAKSFQPSPRDPPGPFLTAAGAVDHTRSSSTNAVRTPVKNPAGAVATPSSSSKRASVMPHHATGLGARTISPTDARRMKRMSIAPPAPPMPHTPPTQTEPLPIRPLSSTQSPSQIPRKSVTPSSNRTTPDPNRKSYSSGLSVSSSTSYNSARNSGSSLQNRLSHNFSSSRLPTPKPRTEQTNSNGEEVPPVPAIPKAYESPKGELDAPVFPAPRKSSIPVDIGLLNIKESSSDAHTPTSGTVNSHDPTESINTPEARTRTSTVLGGRKGLQPLKLPPLNLLPLGTPMAAKIDALKDRDQDRNTHTPSNQVLSKTPSTPMTASKANFWYRDDDDEKVPLTQARSSTSHFAVSTSTAALRTSSSTSAFESFETPNSTRNISPYASYTLPKNGAELNHLRHQVSADYSNRTQAHKLNGPRPQTQSAIFTPAPERLSQISTPSEPESVTTSGSSLRDRLKVARLRSNSKTQKAETDTDPAKYNNMPPPKLPASATWNNLSSVNSTSPSLKPSYLNPRRQSSVSSATNPTARKPSVSSERSLTLEQTRSNDSGESDRSKRAHSSYISPVQKMINNARSSTAAGATPRSADNTVDQDVVIADEEMKRLGSKRKDFQKAASVLDDLRRKAGPKDRVSPAQALKMATLNIFERGEIIDYRDIFFCGTQTAKKHVGDLHSGAANFGYDDDRGDYNIVMGDHLAYRYEVVDVLGKGSFGQVVRCVDHKTGALVAIKIIRNKKRFHQQALIEVNLLQKLKEWDPHGKHSVVNFTQSFYFRGHLCISTELLGMNLYEFIKAHEFRGFSLKLIRVFTKQMLSSLVLLHAKKVIHCDLKPENILLVHPLNSEIRVIDFGSSCFENEKVYTYIQSRFYRSPEVILGMSYGMPIDMWSLGCILAELFTGYPIFPGENEQEQLACIMEVFGPPEKHLIEKSSRKKLFFDSLGKPRLTVSSKGRRRRPSSKELRQALKCDDEAFLDFISRCLRWDPARRISPHDALKHEFLTGIKAPRPRIYSSNSPSKRGATSTSRPLPDPPGTTLKSGFSRTRDVSGTSPVKGGKRHSTVNGPPSSPGKRGSSNITAHGSALPRVSARSISGKPDLATAAAATSLVS